MTVDVGVWERRRSRPTSVACRAMRALPLGVPKVMVSTVASGDVSAYVGVKDIVMIPSIMDVSGINRISREVFFRAAGAICGMAEAQVPPRKDKPLVAASMFGNTTPTVEAAAGHGVPAIADLNRTWGIPSERGPRTGIF